MGTPGRPRRTSEFLSSRGSFSGTIHTRLGPADSADATLAGPPIPILGLLLGLLGPADAKANGIDYQGDPTVLDRIGAQTTAPRELNSNEPKRMNDATHPPLIAAVPGGATGASRTVRSESRSTWHNGHRRCGPRSSRNPGFALTLGCPAFPAPATQLGRSTRDLTVIAIPDTSGAPIQRTRAPAQFGSSADRPNRRPARDESAITSAYRSAEKPA